MGECFHCLLLCVRCLACGGVVAACGAAAIEDAANSLTQQGNQLGVGAWSETVSPAWRSFTDPIARDHNINQLSLDLSGNSSTIVDHGCAPGLRRLAMITNW
jgi:hypothetical protein